MAPLLLVQLYKACAAHLANPQNMSLWAIRVAKVFQSIAQHSRCSENHLPYQYKGLLASPTLSLPWPHHLEGMCQQSRGSVQHQKGSHQQTEARCGAVQVLSPHRGGRSVPPAVHWLPATGRPEDLRSALPFWPVPSKHHHPSTCFPSSLGGAWQPSKSEGSGPGTDMAANPCSPCYWQ